MDLPPDAVLCETRGEWRAWLKTNAEHARGIWLATYRKASGKPILAYEDAVEEALCFGWVDSRPRALDEARTLLWFAPRKPGSGWARPNKERVKRLIASGLMQPSGLRVVERAKADGTWKMLDEVEDLVVPDDLATAMSGYPDAAKHWEAFPRSAKRGILEWIVQAKTAETRAKRVAETARLAQDNVRAKQWRPKE